MSDQITVIANRLRRIENMLAEVLHKGPEKPLKRLSEKAVIEKYGISRDRLKKLRLGYKKADGTEVPPAILHWGHQNGRHIDYDAEELEQVFKRIIH